MSRLFMINKSYTGTYQSFERDLIIAMPLCPPTAKYPQLMYINVGNADVDNEIYSYTWYLEW